MTTYVQLRFSRTDGRSWDTGVAGLGERKLAEARAMAERLTQSSATDFIEIVTEQRDGAMSSGTTTERWSRRNGWSE